MPLVISYFLRMKLILDGIDESNGGIETKSSRAKNRRTTIVAAICPKPTMKNDGNLEVEEHVQ